MLLLRSQILRNKSALLKGIFITFTCFQTLRLENVAFHTKQDFLFHIDRYHFGGPSSSKSKEPRFRLLENEAHTSKILNKLVFWRRQPRLVTYATEISLLRSLVASQQ